MKEIATKDLRNIALVAHGGAGKTSLAEAILFSAGETTRMGSVDDGSTVSDYQADEIERKISVSTTLMHCFWKDVKINIVDAPGYADFFGDAVSALRVADLAVVLVDAVSGIAVGTENVMEIVTKQGTPRLFFVNREDKEHANFEKAVAAAQERFGHSVTVVQFPASEGESFKSIVDLVHMKLVTFATDGSGKYTMSDIPAELKAKADGLREKLVEMVAECDDAILESYFEKGSLSPEEFAKGLKTGILKGTLAPVLCGAATKNVGTHLLLDFIATYCPSPVDLSPVKGTAPGNGQELTRPVDPSASLAALVFKTVAEAHLGELSLVRVYTGTLRMGDEVLNATTGSTEKIGQIYIMNGKTRKEVGVLVAGDCGALVKLRNTHTGDCLTAKKDPILLPGIAFPTPVTEVAIVPKSKGDEEKISNGLQALRDEDPSFTVEVNPELRQTIIAGQGELHLDVIIKRLKEKFGVDVDVQKPRIPYRETITGKADEKYRHKKQTGGAGQFAEVWMKVEPLPRGAGFEFENQVVGGAISSVFIPSVEKGVRQVLEEGALAGFKIVDVKAIVYDGKEHPVDSKDIAFQIAGREVFKMAFLNAKPILLEPIYDIEVKVPEENMGEVMGDLSSRRGRILGMDSAGHYQIVRAKVPLAELHKYATTLRSITQGRATYRRSFSHYEPLPKELEAKVIEEAKAERERERAK
ncbi:MAG: elongation factor G [candidate division KSB1 bacterium]|nr:elongation factor G [candidate division KSB1 bacterium]MDZ7393792.1 elongation factor G [candidate division KSB1 bacterium]